jgi:signal transduction histidine kinase
LDQPTVLIVSDEAEFSRAITTRWQSQPLVPVFTLVSGDLCQAPDEEAFDLAILGSVRRALFAPALAALEDSARPVIVVSDRQPKPTRAARAQVVELGRHEGWLETLVLVASETLLRTQAVAHADGLERANRALACQAQLGRYIVEMRHNLNNALTTVLGNSELLLLEEGSLTPAVRFQIETIRSMGLRMHEVLQRFSSLENEGKVSQQLASSGGEDFWPAAGSYEDSPAPSGGKSGRARGAVGK